MLLLEKYIEQDRRRLGFFFFPQNSNFIIFTTDCDFFGFKMIVLIEFFVSRRWLLSEVRVFASPLFSIVLLFSSPNSLNRQRIINVCTKVCVNSSK